MSTRVLRAGDEVNSIAGHPGRQSYGPRRLTKRLTIIEYGAMTHAEMNECSMLLFY